MFDTVSTAPPDAILGLTEAFRNDENPHKINLGVGVYKDANGGTPVLDAVKAAEQRLVDSEATKGYLPIGGDPVYCEHARKLLLGDDHALLESGRLFTVQTPGGTGGLRVAGDYIKSCHPGATLWMSDPTWPNHPSVFEAAGLSCETYPYFDAERNALDAEAMSVGLSRVKAGDVVLLHGCCHNPTGVDLTIDQWKAVAELIRDKGALPLVDFAYQGFALDLDVDAGGLRALLDIVPEALVCSSYSKNFGLYRDRVGALTVLAGSPAAAGAVESQVKQVIRRNYSNPPAHGGAVVRTILDDAGLRKQWESELTAMRDRINTMRALFAKSLDDRNVQLSPSGNAFVIEQRGMFTMSGIGKDAIARLRDEHAVYVVGSGRINVAGMTEQNMPYLCDAIAASL